MFARWQPQNLVTGPINELQSEMNRLFNRWNDERSQPRSSSSFPFLNIREEGDQLDFTAELPGVDMEDLEIYVASQNQLAIKGARKFSPPPNAVRHRQERAFGEFNRVLSLPVAVDANKVEARLERGILHIRIAKHESAKPRKIHVSGD